MQAFVVDVPGAINRRDFGGWPVYGPTHDVARGRRGALYRCGQLSGLGSEGSARLAALGIAVGAGAPSRILVPIDPDHGLNEAHITDRLERRRDYMRALYRVLIARHTPDYASVFESLIRHAGSGFLVHCTAGKDRTGVAAALILSALGVRREDVVADYLHTNDALDFAGFIAPRLRPSTAIPGSMPPRHATFPGRPAI
jgi:protein-tyrosine phosphatase